MSSSNLRFGSTAACPSAFPVVVGFIVEVVGTVAPEGRVPTCLSVGVGGCRWAAAGMAKAGADGEARLNGEDISRDGCEDFGHRYLRPTVSDDVLMWHVLWACAKRCAEACLRGMDPFMSFRVASMNATASMWSVAEPCKMSTGSSQLHREIICEKTDLQRASEIATKDLAGVQVGQPLRPDSQHALCCTLSQRGYGLHPNACALCRRVRCYVWGRGCSVNHVGKTR